MNEILLDNIVTTLQKVVDCLYQENLVIAYETLAAVFPKLEEVIASMDEHHQGIIQEKLVLVLDAMEQQDSVLLADAIQYDLLAALSEISDK